MKTYRDPHDFRREVQVTAIHREFGEMPKQASALDNPYPPSFRMNLKEGLDEFGDYEMFAREKSLRNRELRIAWNKRPPKETKLLWSGDEEKCERFIRQGHADLNEMRVRMGRDPLPGDGWSDWEAGKEYVPEQRGWEINVDGHRRRVQ